MSSDLLEHVRDFLIRHALVAPPATADRAPSRAPSPSVLVIGVSGGIDSVCLLHLCHRLAPELSMQLHLAHVNHGLRSDAAVDEAFTRRLCQEFGLPLHIQQLRPEDAEHTQCNMEDWARRVRYRFLLQVTINVTAPGAVPTLAVAHHADDQAETVLMNLVRGAGLRGLAAMPALRTVDPHAFCDLSPGLPPTRLVRPLLGVTRTQIAAYADEFRLPWREDPSNQDLRITRNYIRHQIMPQLSSLNPDVVMAIARSAELLQGEADHAQQRTQAALMASVDEALDLSETGKISTHSARIVLAAPALFAHEQSTQRSLLQLALQTLAPRVEMGLDRIDNLLRDMNANRRTSGPHPINAALSWSRRGAQGGRGLQISIHAVGQPAFAAQGPLLEEKFARRTIPEEGNIRIGNWMLQSRVIARPKAFTPQQSALCAHFDAMHTLRLALCAPEPGLSIAPLGMAGRHKAVRRLFNDHKVPPALRAQWPMIVDAERNVVLWVCGLRQAEQAKITPHTIRVRQLCWVHCNECDSAQSGAPEKGPAHARQR